MKNLISMIPDEGRIIERQMSRHTSKSPALALLLSAVLPGLGQLYNAQHAKGLIIVLAVLIDVWRKKKR